MFQLSVVKVVVFLTIYFLDTVYGNYADYGGCSFELVDDNNITARYNLSWFHLLTDSFLVDDDDIVDWKYRFNVCGYIPEISWDTLPDYCKSSDGYRHFPCIKIADDGTCSEKYNVTAMKKPASAVQINSAHTVCWWLGAELNDLGLTSDYSIELYDSHNSGAGVVYTINNGAWCVPTNGDDSQNRELRVELTCPDSPRYEFDPSQESSISEEVVVENPSCVYTVSYESALACPYDCIAQSSILYSVCSGNGICASDENAKKVKCLCDDGWTGDLCDVESLYDVEKVTSVHSSLITSVIICIILLVIAIGVSLYLCHRIRLREEQVISGTHGQYAQSMLDNDETTNISLDDGTSMGIQGTQNKQNIESQAFDPNISVDPSIQNEIAQQHAKDVLQHGNNNDDNDDDNDNDNDNDNNEPDADDANAATTNEPTQDNEINENETQDVEEAGNNTQREEEDLLGA